MKVRVFVFKTRKLKDGFINRSESSNFITSQYMKNQTELHVSDESLKLAERDGYISRYIVNGVEIIDEINSIDNSDFEKGFKFSDDYDLEVEKTPVVEIDEDELYSAIMSDLDKPMKPVPVVIEEPIIDESIYRKSDLSDFNLGKDLVVDLSKLKPKDPAEYMFQTVTDVMGNAKQYEMTITKGRDGEQCLQLKVEW